MSLANPSSPAEEQVAKFLTYVERRRTHSTHVTYRSTMRQLLPFTKDQEWGVVTLSTFEAFLDRPRQRGCSEAAHNTLVREIRVIRSFYTWLGKNGGGHLDWDIDELVPRKGAPRSQREPVPDDHFLLIWESNLDAEDRLLVGLGYYCGLRRMEMRALMADDLEPRDARLGSGKFSVMRKGKGGVKQVGIGYAAIIERLGMDPTTCHLVPDGDDWMDLLEATAKMRSGRYGLPLLQSITGHDENDDAGLWRRFRAVQRKAGIPEAELMTLHSMRHSAATNLALAGVEADVIRLQLGHSSAEMTAHYTDASRLLAAANRRDRQRRAQ